MLCLGVLLPPIPPHSGFTGGSTSVLLSATHHASKVSHYCKPSEGKDHCLMQYHTLRHVIQHPKHNFKRASGFSLILVGPLRLPQVTHPEGRGTHCRTASPMGLPWETAWETPMSLDPELPVLPSSPSPFTSPPLSHPQSLVLSPHCTGKNNKQSTHHLKQSLDGRGVITGNLLRTSHPKNTIALGAPTVHYPPPSSTSPSVFSTIISQ